MASPTLLHILHIDMDAFFASVEQLDNPALRGQCVIVGADSRRGVVAAASYEARRFGIHSAMPVYQAKKKCAQLIIVPPRRRRYAELSGRVMDILGKYSPLVEPVSIDEAYMDVEGCDRLHGPPVIIAKSIKSTILRELGLTCSIGVASNKFLAKVASDMNKPDGLTLIEPEKVNAFIDNLPIAKVPGVGPQACRILSAMGISFLGQVRRFPLPLLVGKLGRFGNRLADLSNGHDDSVVSPCHDVKSVSNETTFEADTADRTLIASYLLAQAQSVASTLHRNDVRARTIPLKTRTSDFQRHTRSRTLPEAVQDSTAIYEAALELLDQGGLKGPIRLVGIAAGNLQTVRQPVQCGLFPDEREARQGKWEKIDRVVDAIAGRFGSDQIARAGLHHTDGPFGRKKKK